MIEVDIVTPVHKFVVGARVESVRLPGEDGEIAVLAGHTELMTLLGTGPLTMIREGKERRFAVSYGFAEVRQDRVLVLAEAVEEEHDIDVERAKAAEKKATEALTGTLTEKEFRKQQLKLRRAQTRQQVGSRRHHPLGHA